MYLLSYKGSSFASKAIKLVTWGDVSHSAIASNDGWVQEVWEGCGYSLVADPWENHTEGTPIDVYTIDGADEAVWKAGLAEQGSTYEFASLAGFLPLLRHWWRDSLMLGSVHSSWPIAVGWVVPRCLISRHHCIS